MKKRILISIMLIVTFCLLTSCQKAAGNNSKGFLLDSDRDKLVAVKDSDIAKLRIGMTIREVKNT